jgi:hypothetical protein
MPRKIRELRAELRRSGFSLARTRGSHTMWEHPLVPGISANLAGRDGADAKPYQENEVRQALLALREAQRKQQP